MHLREVDKQLLAWPDGFRPPPGGAKTPQNPVEPEMITYQYRGGPDIGRPPGPELMRSAVV